MTLSNSLLPNDECTDSVQTGQFMRLGALHVRAGRVELASFSCEIHPCACTWLNLSHNACIADPHTDVDPRGATEQLSLGTTATGSCNVQAKVAALAGRISYLETCDTLIRTSIGTPGVNAPCKT